VLLYFSPYITEIKSNTEKKNIILKFKKK